MAADRGGAAANAGASRKLTADITVTTVSSGSRRLVRDKKRRRRRYTAAPALGAFLIRP